MSEARLSAAEHGEDSIKSVCLGHLYGIGTLVLGKLMCFACVITDVEQARAVLA